MNILQAMKSSEPASYYDRQAAKSSAKAVKSNCLAAKPGTSAKEVQQFGSEVQ